MEFFRILGRALTLTAADRLHDIVLLLNIAADKIASSPALIELEKEAYARMATAHAQAKVRGAGRAPGAGNSSLRQLTDLPNKTVRGPVQVLRAVNRNPRLRGFPDTTPRPSVVK